MSFNQALQKYEAKPWVAVSVCSGTLATAITAGGAHTCAVLSSGDVMCWGLNTGGQLGLGSQILNDIVSCPARVNTGLFNEKQHEHNSLGCDKCTAINANCISAEGCAVFLEDCIVKKQCIDQA